MATAPPDVLAQLQEARDTIRQLQDTVANLQDRAKYWDVELSEGLQFCGGRACAGLRKSVIITSLHHIFCASGDPQRGRQSCELDQGG